jgi:hypothetical protein
LGHHGAHYENLQLKLPITYSLTVISPNKYGISYTNQFIINIHFPLTRMICFFFGKEDMLEASLKNPPSELMEGIPKFVCWELWLARNKAIFHNKLLPPSRFHSLACSLISKKILHQSQIVGFSIGS